MAAIPNTVRSADGTITWTHANGSVAYREAPSGAFYHAETAPELIRHLERAREEGRKVRLFYGDAETGRDWLEEHGVEGRLGRSMGPLKVPLILAPRANHGSALLDHCIVRLRVDGQDVWRHPGYHQGRFELADSGLASHPFAVEVDGAPQANFKTALARQKYFDFITGAPAPAKSKASALSR